MWSQLSSPIMSRSPHDGQYLLLPQETDLVRAHLLPSDGAYKGHHWARCGRTWEAWNLYGLQMLKPEMFLLTAWDLGCMIIFTD